jgi:predicted Fe-Mo cluster-binding NifX family protein
VRVAFTVWNGQLATVADFCRRLLVAEVIDGRLAEQREIDAPGDDALRWCDRLAAHQVTHLVCGAITRHLSERLTAAGIAVIDGCDGSTSEALDAWQCGGPAALRSHRPGCRRQHQTATASHHPFPCETIMHRVAISITGTDLDAALDPRFGRCRHLLVCDGDTATHHENPTATTAEFVARLGVGAVITGAVGPKAMQVLRAAGIRAFASQAPTARAALAEWRAGNLPEAAS